MFLNLTLSLYSILVEILFILSSLLLLLFGVIFSYERKFGFFIIYKIVKKLVFQSLLLGFILIWIQKPIYLLTWNNFFLSNSFTIYSKIIILLVFLVWFLFSMNYVTKEKLISFEYWILVLLNLVSLLFIIQVNDLLSTYLTIEFQSLIFYVLASLKRNSEFSTESGLKYFILGAFSSGLLLFGFSILYSITGLTNLNDLSFFCIQINLISNSYIYKFIFLSLAFILVSFLFKLTVAPFHMWAPDVYEGSPSSVTALFVLMPKLPILGLILKFNIFIFYDFSFFWIYILVFCILASSLMGTFSAFSQIKWKRFVVFSSISHLSFFLLAIISNNFDALVNLFFYLIVYLIMSIGFFSFFINFYIYKFPRFFQVRFFRHVNFLTLLNPLLVVSFSIILFSMAGLPPLGGFFAKFFVLLSGIQSNLVFLVIFMLLCNSISCFYYIRLIKSVYFSMLEPKNFLVILPLDKLSSYILGLSVFILIFMFLDFELIFLLTNLLSFGLI